MLSSLVLTPAMHDSHCSTHKHIHTTRCAHTFYPHADTYYTRHPSTHTIIVQFNDMFSHQQPPMPALRVCVCVCLPDNYSHALTPFVPLPPLPPPTPPHANAGAERQTSRQAAAATDARRPGGHRSGGEPNARGLRVQRGGERRPRRSGRPRRHHRRRDVHHQHVEQIVACAGRPDGGRRRIGRASRRMVVMIARNGTAVVSSRFRRFTHTRTRTHTKQIARHSLPTSQPTIRSATRPPRTRRAHTFSCTRYIPSPQPTDS